MTEFGPVEFRELLDKWEMTIDEFAWLVGHSRQVVTMWGKIRPGRGMQPFPRWVPLLFDAWELGDGPPRGHPWEGLENCELRVTPRTE